MWSIPTQTRFGMGYVYSDEFLTPDKAQAEIETALGHKIEPRNDLRFDIGRQKDAWINNCLSLGLSSSFLEPLEATSIHGTIVQMMVFTNFHLDAHGKRSQTPTTPSPPARSMTSATSSTCIM